MTTPRIRPIRSEDDAAVAAIIREVMPAFGACGPGFALGNTGHFSCDRPYLLEL